MHAALKMNLHQRIRGCSFPPLSSTSSLGTLICLAAASHGTLTEPMEPNPPKKHFERTEPMEPNLPTPAKEEKFDRSEPKIWNLTLPPQQEIRHIPTASTCMTCDEVSASRGFVQCAGRLVSDLASSKTCVTCRTCL